MKKWLLLSIVMAATCVVGCATVTKTDQENVNTWKQIAELDERQIADDWNLIWLSDRQGRLTRFHVR
jgi:hypothetical protein